MIDDALLNTFRRDEAVVVFKYYVVLTDRRDGHTVNTALYESTRWHGGEDYYQENSEAWNLICRKAKRLGIDIEHDPDAETEHESKLVFLDKVDLFEL